MDTIKIKNGSFEDDKITEFIRQNNVGVLVKSLEDLGKIDQNFDIPYKEFKGDVNKNLEKIFINIFK